jgi:circadian clock protein KaiC
MAREDRRRFPTGIVGLDTILRGGLFAGCTYLVLGDSGTGKTVLASQIAFGGAAERRAMMVTFLVESHAAMIANLQSMDFFDEAAIPERVYFVNGYHALENEGPSGLLDLLQRTIRDREVALLVLDSVNSVRSYAATDLGFQQFLRELQAFTNLAGCTTLLLFHSGSPEPAVAAPLVDGLVVLEHRMCGPRAFRTVAVKKTRGSDALEGAHAFAIDSGGLTVYPRLEAVASCCPPADEAERPRRALGIAGLDEMLRGGLPAATSTVVFGSSGSGKTLLATSFLARGAALGERGLYFGFYDWPPRLVGETRGVGVALREQVERGRVELMWNPPYEQLVDALAHELLERIERRKIARLVIDGLDGFAQSVLFAERLPCFLAALANQLRCLGVTAIFTEETRKPFGPSIDLPVEGMSLVAENLIYLNYAEIDSELVRFISILKLREGGYDPSIRRYLIDEHGLQVGERLEPAHAVLGGEPAGEETARRHPGDGR